MRITSSRNTNSFDIISGISILFIVEIVCFLSWFTSLCQANKKNVVNFCCYSSFFFLWQKFCGIVSALLVKFTVLFVLLLLLLLLWLLLHTLRRCGTVSCAGFCGIAFKLIVLHILWKLVPQVLHTLLKLPTMLKPNPFLIFRAYCCWYALKAALDFYRAAKTLQL